MRHQIRIWNGRSRGGSVNQAVEFQQRRIAAEGLFLLAIVSVPILLLLFMAVSRMIGLPIQPRTYSIFEGAPGRIAPNALP